MYIVNINTCTCPMAVLIIDRVEEGSLGMVTTFCHHYMAKVELSEELSILCQLDSPELSIVVVKIFANSPDLPGGLTASSTWEHPLFHWAHKLSSSL